MIYASLCLYAFHIGRKSTLLSSCSAKILFTLLAYYTKSRPKWGICLHGSIILYKLCVSSSYKYTGSVFAVDWLRSQRKTGRCWEAESPTQLFLKNTKIDIVAFCHWKAQRISKEILTSVNVVFCEQNDHHGHRHVRSGSSSLHLFDNVRHFSTAVFRVYRVQLHIILNDSSAHRGGWGNSWPRLGNHRIRLPGADNSVLVELRRVF